MREAGEDIAAVRKFERGGGEGVGGSESIGCRKTGGD